jgi:hypothetical protein
VFDGEFEDKFGSQARAVAVDGECAAHFPGGESATVEAEAVAAFASGEAVLENTGQE